VTEEYPNPPEIWWCPMCGSVKTKCSREGEPPPVCLCLTEEHYLIVVMRKKEEVERG
jgi:hypothetical protein